METASLSKRSPTIPGRAMLVLWLAVLATACRGPAVPSEVEAQRWASAWIAAWNSHSAGQLEGFLPDEAKYWSTMLAEPISGRELARHASFYWRLLPRGKLELREVHRGPGIVAVEWWAFPDAEKYDQRWAGVTWFRLRNGRPVEVRTYFNPTVLLPYLWPPRKPLPGNS